jgi:predicted ATPase
MRRRLNGRWDSMQLQLQNIGMIKEANVNIDGLTVIAGENDTGKSTVGKFIYLIIKYTFDQRKNNKPDFLDIFKSEHLVNENGSFGLSNIQKNQNLKDVIFIESPLVWNFSDFFRDIAQIESQMRIKLEYPYLMKDLNFKLHIKSASDGVDIKKQMTELMGGEFKKDEIGRYYFDKNGEKIELVNTATGIKTFGIFQVLSQNNWLNSDTVLILDEPEVHLHPKWQLEMAKVIVELVKNGVRVVVNSHSPYMIEALERYGERTKISMDFYLAEDGLIHKIDDNNSTTLSKIFQKLSAPYETFDQMDSEILQGG